MGGLLLLEFCAIVLAVALGLMVAEWQESRQRANDTRQALVRLAEEITYNHHRIEAAFVYHRGILAWLAEHNPPNMQTVYESPQWRGFEPAMLRSSSYQMLLNNRALEHLSIGDANALAFIYKTQSVVERLEDSLVTALSLDPSYPSLARIRHVFASYQELLPSLLAVYREQAHPVLSPYGYTVKVQDVELARRVEAMQADLRKRWLKIVTADGLPSVRR
ncbi:MAG TPA: hypothetical protein PLF88_09555 [Opitutaceae bacterium]|nr:hypothetical protein [Opitutaceae bacterium]